MATRKSEDLLRVEAELVQHRRRAALHGRILGAVVLGVGALLANFVHDGMAYRAVYSVELLYITTWFLSCGGILLALGAGGAARIVDIPRTMWIALLLASAVIALIAFIPFGRLLASWAGFSDL